MPYFDPEKNRINRLRQETNQASRYERRAPFRETLEKDWRKEAVSCGIRGKEIALHMSSSPQIKARPSSIATFFNKSDLPETNDGGAARVMAWDRYCEGGEVRSFR